LKIRRCHAFVALRQDYRQRLANLSRVSKRTHELVERLFENEIVTIGDVAEMFDVTPPTARADIDRLVAADVLRPLKRPRIKPQYFIAHDIARIAYVD
jgi:Fic family protein